MTEEQVTKLFLFWLEKNKWEILEYDYPQSGTGIIFRKNNSRDEKNKDAIIPDIIAIKNRVCLFFENKNRYYYPDFEKVNELRIDNQYKEDIEEFLKGKEVKKLYFGIGLPTVKYKSKAESNKTMTDFIFGISDEKTIEALYDPNKLVIL